MIIEMTGLTPIEILDTVTANVLEITEAYASYTDIDVYDQFEDIGIDEYNKQSIASDLETLFSLELDPDVVSDFDSVQELVDYVVSAFAY